MNIEDVIRSRRSVRRFRPVGVPPDTLERVLESATWAPSAHNRQPWRFVVLASSAARERLMDQMGAAFQQVLLDDGLSMEEASRTVERSRQRVLGAPVAVLLCLDRSVGDAYPDADRQEAEHLMGVQSVAMAGATLLLAAHAEGLGGVWICAPLFAQRICRSALGLPEPWEAQGLILLGYPEQFPAARPRQPLEEVARFM